AAVAGIGMAFKGGLESALNVDTVTRSLAGLHGSAEAAADTMERVARVSRDSSINHADYAAAAQNLAYIGVEGDQLERILTNAGDVAVDEQDWDSGGVESEQRVLIRRSSCVAIDGVGEG